MSYEDIDDLPPEEVAQYSRSQKGAFKRAYNRALEHGKKKDDALREAHIDARHAADRT